MRWTMITSNKILFYPSTYWVVVFQTLLHSSTGLLLGYSGRMDWNHSSNKSINQFNQSIQTNNQPTESTQSKEKEKRRKRREVMFSRSQQIVIVALLFIFWLFVTQIVQHKAEEAERWKVPKQTNN